MTNKREQLDQSPSFAIKITKLEEHFKQISLSFGEPLTYSTLFLKFLSSKHYENKQEEYKYKMYSFADEINRIKKGESFCQQLQILMSERDEHIRQLRTQLINSRNSKQLNISTACERLEHIRTYSLMIVEKLKGLKLRLKVNESAYYAEVLNKIGQDVDFLKVSPLRKHIEFSNNADPLFIYPMKKFWNMEVVPDALRRPIIDLFSLEPDYRKRLERAHRFVKKAEQKEEQQSIEGQDSQEDMEVLQTDQNFTLKEHDVRIQPKMEDFTKNTLQKFILPSVNTQNRRKIDIVNDKKKRLLVSTLIKDVISDYEQKDKQKYRNAQKSINSSTKAKKRAATRSIDRQDGDFERPPRQDFSNSRANEIKYRIGKTSTMHNNKQDAPNSRRQRKNQKLPELNKSKRVATNPNTSIGEKEDESDFTNQNYSIAQNHFHTVDMADLSNSKARENQGKIVKNFIIRTEAQDDTMTSPYRNMEASNVNKDSPPEKYFKRSNERSQYDNIQCTTPVKRNNLQLDKDMPKAITNNSYRLQTQNEGQKYHYQYQNSKNQYEEQYYTQDRQEEFKKMKEMPQQYEMRRQFLSQNEREQERRYQLQNLRKDEGNAKRMRRKQFETLQKQSPERQKMMRKQYDQRRYDEANIERDRSRERKLMNEAEQKYKFQADSTEKQNIYLRSRRAIRMKTLEQNYQGGNTPQSHQTSQQRLPDKRQEQIDRFNYKPEDYRSDLLEKLPDQKIKSIGMESQQVQPSKIQPAQRQQRRVLLDREASNPSNNYKYQKQPYGYERMQEQKQFNRTPTQPMSPYSPINYSPQANHQTDSKLTLKDSKNPAYTFNTNNAYNPLNHPDQYHNNQPDPSYRSNQPDQSYRSQNSVQEQSYRNNYSQKYQTNNPQPYQNSLDMNQNSQRRQEINYGNPNSANQFQSEYSRSIQDARMPAKFEQKQNEFLHQTQQPRQSQQAGQIQQYQEPQRYQQLQQPQSPQQNQLPRQTQPFQQQSPKPPRYQQTLKPQQYQQIQPQQSSRMQNQQFQQEPKQSDSLQPTQNNQNIIDSKRSQNSEALQSRNSIKKQSVNTNTPSTNIETNKIINQAQQPSNGNQPSSKLPQKPQQNLISPLINKQSSNPNINFDSKTKNKSNFNDSLPIIRETNSQTVQPKDSNITIPVFNTYPEPNKSNQTNETIKNQGNTNAYQNIETNSNINQAARIPSNQSINVQPLNQQKVSNYQQSKPIIAPIGKSTQKQMNNQKIDQSSLPRQNEKPISIEKRQQAIVVPTESKQERMLTTISKSDISSKPLETSSPAKIEQVNAKTKLSNENTNKNMASGNESLKKTQNIKESDSKQQKASVVNIEGPSPSLQESKSTTKQEQVLSTETKALLQKCVFQSKSITDVDLLKQVKKISGSKYELLKPYLLASYFANRHISITNCLLNGQIVCYCIFFPQIMPDLRMLYILHFEVVLQKMLNIQTALFSTFIKYIFTNDPCEKIIYLRHNGLMNQSLLNNCKSVRNFTAEMKTPLKMPTLAETSLLLQRKGLKCKQTQDFTSVIYSYALFVTSQPSSVAFQKAASKNIKISEGLLQKMKQQFMKNKGKKFETRQKLDSFIDQQGLPKFKKLKMANNIAYNSQILEDCLLKPRFFVHSKQFFFTVEPPLTYLYQNENAYFFLLTTSDPKKFFLFGDKLYEEAEDMDMEKQFRQKINNRPFEQIFKADKGKGKVISCPVFKKIVEMELSPTSNALFCMQLNWKQYIKGVRYLPQDKVYLELITPFFFALIQTDANQNIKSSYTAIIEEADLVK